MSVSCPNKREGGGAVIWILVILLFMAGCVIWQIHHAAEFNPAWEEEMLTQEELEELANALWESDDDES